MGYGYAGKNRQKNVPPRRELRLCGLHYARYRLWRYAHSASAESCQASKTNNWFNRVEQNEESLPRAAIPMRLQASAV